MALPLRSFVLVEHRGNHHTGGYLGAYWRDTLLSVGLVEEDTAPFPGSVLAKLFFPPLIIWEPRCIILKFQGLGISKQLWRQASVMAITTVLFLVHGSRCKSRAGAPFRDAADLLPSRVREKLQSASKGGMEKGPTT